MYILTKLLKIFGSLTLFYYFSVPSLSGTVTVEVPEEAPYSYEEYSVLQLKVREKYGRYLTFVGTSPNEYKGTSGYYSPGTSGTINCTTYGNTTTCNRSGYRASSYTPPTPGGIQKRKWRYELDCQDLTFDRKGDISSGIYKKGWLSVDKDPTAKAVANKYCPIIHTLYKVP